MARVVVNVMPKAEILDPQGQAIVGALGRLGHSGISDVRQGKRFELEVDTTKANEKWNVEVEENLRRKATDAAQQEREAGQPAS